MDELHHECGVAALYYLPARADRSAVWTGDPDQVSRHMPRMLLDLQNRGQLAAGMATFNPARGKLLANYKEIGTVIEAFRMNDPAKYASIMEDFAGRAMKAEAAPDRKPVDVLQRKVVGRLGHPILP